MDQLLIIIDIKIEKILNNSEDAKGYIVDLREMGKLSISVKSMCVDDPSDFRSDKHITGFVCNYTPQGKRYQGTSEKNRKHIHRSILDGCEAVETKYY